MKHVPTELPVDLSDLLDLAEDQGWKIDRTGKNHYKLTSPNGAITGHSGTPSDRRAIMNFRARLKRLGLLPYNPPPTKPAVAVAEVEVEYFKPEQNMEEIVVPEENKERAIHGAVQALITKILREHDKPEGLNSQEIFEFARITVPKIEKKKVGQSLAYYAKTGLVSKPSHFSWRLAEFGGTPNASSKPTEEDDVAALERALDALATIEKMVRKTIAQRKELAKLREIMAKMG